MRSSSLPISTNCGPAQAAAFHGSAQDGGDLGEFALNDAKKNEQEFDGEVIKSMVAANWVDPPRRERKTNYNENVLLGVGRAPKGPKELRLPRMQQYSDFQFFNTTRLRELYDKEGAYLLHKHQKAQAKKAAEEAAKEAGGAAGEEEAKVWLRRSAAAAARGARGPRALDHQFQIHHQSIIITSSLLPFFFTPQP